MTVIPSFQRALYKQLAIRTKCIHSTRAWSSLRVVVPRDTLITKTAPFTAISTHSSSVSSTRAYATDAPARKTTAKSTIRKTTKKTTKTASKKPKTKAKAKPKKKVLTEAQKERLVKRKEKQTEKAAKDKVKARKETALLSAEPKGLPSTAWQVLMSEAVKGSGGNAPSKFKEAAEKYKNLSPEERERYNQIANENKAKNEAEYKKWVSSFTPLEIKAANTARKAIASEARKQSTKSVSAKYIHDDRLVRPPRNAYSFFGQDRHASGDYKGMSLVESSKLLAREWKDMSESEKKPYIDQAEAEKRRYTAEYKTVYGTDVPSKK